MTNPFAQVPACWQMTFDAPVEAVIALEDAFAEIALAVSSFERTDDPSRWNVQILADHSPAWREAASHIEKALGISLPPPEIKKLEAEDWQPALSRDFPPLIIGRFFVHGAHAKEARPPHLWPVRVEAGMAFGSGEHATTSGCLWAIDAFSKNRNFSRILDMGCGSGILAAAASRAWPKARILAVDSDGVSARIAGENMRLNGIKNVRVLAGNGYKRREVGARGPYDLILANILARPLVSLSHDLKRHLKPGGIAILSGLLANQQKLVLAAHRRQGLRLKRRILRQGWATLVLGG